MNIGDIYLSSDAIILIKFLLVSFTIGAVIIIVVGWWYGEIAKAQREREAVEEAAWEAEELRWEEWETKQCDLANRWKALSRECDRLLTKAEDYSDRAYVEHSERWSELADSYLEQAEVCENAMKIIEKMHDEIDLEYMKR